VSYWKAYRSQLRYNEILRYRDQVQQALQRSKKAVKLRVASMTTQLDYQQLLIRNMRRLNKQELQLNQAKSELASLMSVRPYEKFRLAKPDAGFENIPNINIPMKELDTVALIHRPELKSAAYRTRIAAKGITAAILQLLPGLHFDYGYNHSSNKYIKNDDWYDTNIISTWNAMKLLNAPSVIANAKTQKELGKLTQVALTMGVLSQVRIAYNEYQIYRKDYLYSVSETRNADALYQQTQRLAKANMSNKQAVTRRGIAALNARLERDLSLAKAYQSLAKLRLSIGLNYLPKLNIEKTPLVQLEKIVHQTILEEQQGDINKKVRTLYRQLTSATAKNINS
jgi:outer membrane protein, multidrug efflux system